MTLEYAVRIERNVQEAIQSWIAAAREWKEDVPAPSPPLARAG